MRKEILIGVGIEVPFKNWAEVVRETVIPYRPTRITPDISIRAITPLPKPTRKLAQKRRVKAKKPLTSIGSIRDKGSKNGK